MNRTRTLLALFLSLSLLITASAWAAPQTLPSYNNTVMENSISTFTSDPPTPTVSLHPQTQPPLSLTLFLLCFCLLLLLLIGILVVGVIARNQNKQDMTKDN
jgi:hypothetical protein